MGSLKLIEIFESWYSGFPLKGRQVGHILAKWPKTVGGGGQVNFSVSGKSPCPASRRNPVTVFKTLQNICAKKL